MSKWLHYVWLNLAKTPPTTVSIYVSRRICFYPQNIFRSLSIAEYDGWDSSKRLEKAWTSHFCDICSRRWSINPRRCSISDVYIVLSLFSPIFLTHNGFSSQPMPNQLPNLIQPFFFGLNRHSRNLQIHDSKRIKKKILKNLTRSMDIKIDFKQKHQKLILIDSSVF